MQTPIAYLTTGDVAERLGISQRTVMRWADLGDDLTVAAVAGENRLFDPAQVERLAAELAAKAEARATALREGAA